jgi:hypothetical protein
MGAVQLGGMLLSTLFTLVLVPTVFSLWMDAQAGLRTRFRRQPAALREEEVDLLPQAEKVQGVREV